MAETLWGDRIVDENILSILKRFIVERYLVKLNKEFYKLPFPWTNWKELSENRFTNLKREHDKESKLLIKSTLDNDNLTVQEKIINSFIFRAYNKYETYSFLEFPKKYSVIDEKEVERLRLKIQAEKPSFTPYTNAFMVSGLAKSWKPYPCLSKKEGAFLRFVELWNFLIRERVAEKIVKCKSASEAGALCKVKGFGEFLAYQVFLDLTYIRNSPFSEQEWVISGPGCTKGLKRLFIKKENPELLLYWLRDNSNSLLNELGVDLKALMVDLPEEERTLTLANWENIFCELSKIIALVKNEKASKRRKYEGLTQENLF